MTGNVVDLKIKRLYNELCDVLSNMSYDDVQILICQMYLKGVDDGKGGLTDDAENVADLIDWIEEHRRGF